MFWTVIPVSVFLICIIFHRINLAENRAVSTIIEDANVLDELKKIPISEWPEIYCEFNSWNFPKQLSHIKPIWWDDTFWGVVGAKKSALIGPVHELITRTVGEKATSRYWNTVHRKDPGKMSIGEHEDWWNNERSNFR